MILRRFMKHVTDQNWFAVGLDVVVVIVGIFLGMQVTDWNSNQEIKREVEVYKHRLRLELKENLSRIDNDILYYQGVKHFADLVFRDIDKSVEELDANFILNVYQGTQRTGQRVANFTINEINSTGMLKHFKDLNIRRLIQNYDNSLKTNETNLAPISNYRIKIRGLLSTEIQEIILTSCEELIITVDFETTHTVMNRDCKLELNEDLYKSQIIKLKQYSNLKEDLTYKISLINWKMTYLGVYKQQAENLLLQLEK
jgi:hypothetical protein